MGSQVGLRTLLFLVAISTCNAGDVHFKRHTISDETDYSAAALMDVNRDGQVDIVCGGDWYEGPTWKKHFLAEIPRIGGRPDGYAHLPFDVNRDGWTDLITVNYRSRSIKWMEHPGQKLGEWPTHVAVEPGPMETGRLVDIDGDGKLDLLPNGASFAAWWEFRWKDDRQGEPAWIRHDLPQEAGGHGLGFGDINGDGRGDIVGQNGWLEAPPDARSGQWKWHADFRLERASIPMLVVDADEDGDADIVWCSAHGFGVYWLEHAVNERGQHQWTRHAIDTSWSQGHSPLWHDMDGDGRPELITGKRYMAHGGKDPGEYDPLAIYRYEFQPKTRTWNRSTVSPLGHRVGVGLDPKIADIDNDGDPDLLTSGRSGLYWLENLTAAKRTASRPAAPIPTTAIPTYGDHDELLVVKSNEGKTRTVKDPEAWGIRRSHIISAIEREQASLPPSSARTRLEIATVNDASNEGVHSSTTIEYSIDANRRVRARIVMPSAAVVGKSIGLVCLFDESMSESAPDIAGELASVGFVCIVPEPRAADQSPQDAGSLMDGVWQSVRAADVLQANEFVHGEKIGFVGNALQGQLGLHVAATDQRFIATVTDLTDGNPTASNKRFQYTTSELLAAIAPRSLTAMRPDSSLTASAMEQPIDLARAVFQLRRAASNLETTNTTLQSSPDARLVVWRSLMKKFVPQYKFRIPSK